MGKISIVADGTCDLSQELLDKYNISIIPLNIVLDMKSYLDGKEITPDQIYEWAEKVNSTPKTAAPEIGYIVELLRPMVEAGDDIIFFGISEEMSVTCQTVRMAAEELSYQNIWVINSENLSTGIGLQVLRAAEYARQGKSADWIVKEIEACREKVRASFVVDTLTYLHRGGRCSAVAALFGNALKLKPMISVNKGKMGVAKKYRGKQQSVIRNYGKDLEPMLLQADPERVFITHSGIDPAIEQETYDYLKSLNYFKEILITRAGGVISSHCGPNTLGILYYDK
ncbi:DegV family protein [Lachnospiraceae bacterium MD1]|uniref:DegV family protein n=1 Tax=Variimorphobacter saccharofermentans TaxID=2755051 RepID=A0A839K1X9_9FIRM|nr:DegV family protein [Variimorphobacter saccharofermentans]MBB2183915.1 DegV family protein [Variimorphobacter saccharofermentans]